MKAILFSVICSAALAASALGQVSQPLPKDPAFAKILIAEINACDPGRPPQATSDANQSLARHWVSDALQKPASRRQVCAYLDTLGPDGAAAKAKLMSWPAPAVAQPPAAQPSRVPAGLSSPAADSLQKGKWDAAGSRLAFDGSPAASDGGPAPVPAGPDGAHPSPLAPSPNLPEILTKPVAPGTIKIVAVAWDKLQKIAQKQVYQERSASFNEAFGGADVPMSGGGAFKVKILTPVEVASDTVKQAVRDEGLKHGQKIVFVRTDVKAQLGASAVIPIDNPTGLPSVSLSAGLNLSGFVEIVETRETTEDKAGAMLKAQARVFTWPLTAEHIKNVMKVGEDLAITGRLDESAAQALGVGSDLGLDTYAHVGTNAGASVGAAADQWITLHLKKVDPDHVRILLQKADGKTFSLNVAATTGLQIYNSLLTPAVTPTSLEQGLLGKAVVGGENSALNQIQQLFSASISDSWSKGKDDLEAEGWASVSLSDPKVSAALNSLFKFRPEALRGLPADSTFSKELDAGRFKADVRDITHNEAFQANISKLKVAMNEGTAFYEVRWQQDGRLKHYVVGLTDARYHGDVTKTNREEQLAMWYDLDTKKTAVTVALGPQDRLMTTTREKVNDVIATQQAMGVSVTGKYQEPKPYLQLFGLGNIGRSEEKGSFYLSDEGVQSLRGAGRDQLIAAYLHADWLYEKQSWPPGQNFWAQSSKPPAWAQTVDPAALKPVLDFLHDHASEARRLQSDKDGRSQLAGLQSDYARLAPGRFLMGDCWAYTDANDYANQVRDLQNSDNPEQLVELFMKFRKDEGLDLKRAVVATATLAGEHAGSDGKPSPNWQGWMQMTGKNVTLVPAGGAPKLPLHPVSELQTLMGQWQ
jgi:hypothetical protein